VLAYSTVSQLGYMMAAIGAGFASAGFLHLLTHGIFKALLFLGAGAVIHAVGTNDIFAMGGLWRRMPQTAIVFVIGTLSLAGIPLFGGFFSKEEILGAVLVGGFTVPFAMLLLGAFLTAFYMFRVVFVTFAGVPAAPPAGHRSDGSHVHDAPPFMALPLWILAVMCVGIGILFAAWHPAAEFEMLSWVTPAAIAVSLGGIALAYLVYERRAISADALAKAFAPIRAAALRRFWIDDAFAFVYRRLILSLSWLVGWVDRYLVDGLVNLFSAWTLSAGGGLRRIQSGRAQDYVYGIALGVLLLMVWIRWPR
jgi:NADH-quinone oxidoreductase subunit L